MTTPSKDDVLRIAGECGICDLSSSIFGDPDVLTNGYAGKIIIERFAAAMYADGAEAKRQLAAERAVSDKLAEALRELRALVWGECPALLNDDSGGNGVLDVEIDIALAEVAAVRKGEQG